MDLNDLKNHYGSIPNAARALGLVRQAVYQWKDGIPALRQIQIERMTIGALKADPNCWLEQQPIAQQPTQAAA